MTLLMGAIVRSVCVSANRSLGHTQALPWPLGVVNRMKKAFSFLLAVLLGSVASFSTAWAQDRIYRCGDEYTNNPGQAKERDCKLVEGGNVTVVQGTRASGAAASPPLPATASASAPARPAASKAPPASSPPNAPRVDLNAQRARDADARAILESELRKSETRLAELQAEYNQGAPQRNALDLRNTQHYMDRTAALKEKVARAESDVAGIRRELGRLPPASR